VTVTNAANGFEILKHTLLKEMGSELPPDVTKNVFLQRYDELSEQMNKMFGAVKSPVVVCSDGVFKQSGDAGVSIDQQICGVFRDLNIEFFQIVLSDVFGCKPDEVHASVDAVDRLKQVLGGQAVSAVVVVGSGSVTDVVKHSLFELGWQHVPFVVIPTALTVTAFTSHFAVLEEAGAKRTRMSRRVDECVWYCPVISAAPQEMTGAGYGDLLARFVAYGDWYLAWKLGVAARYDELAHRLMEPFGSLLRQHAVALRQWPVEQPAMRDLSATLAMAGIAMSVSGETTPLSGYEHTVSHALDYLRLSSGRALSWHGQQVALASLVSAQSFDHLLSLESIDLQTVKPLSDERVKRTIRNLILNAPYFGAGEQGLSPEQRRAGLQAFEQEIDKACALFTQDYLKKHALWTAVQDKATEFQNEWPEIRARLRELVLSADELERLVELSGLPTTPEELSQPTTAQEFRWAVRFAPFVRSRMSLADLIFWLGEDPALWAVI
jgi:glycerol-1-phosphate dehydrogenase [NAD(P)+]